MCAGVILANVVRVSSCASHIESAGSTYERCDRFWMVEYSRYCLSAVANVTVFGACSCQVPFSIFVCSADQVRNASRSRRNLCMANFKIHEDFLRAATL